MKAPRVYLTGLWNRVNSSISGFLLGIDNIVMPSKGSLRLQQTLRISVFCLSCLHLCAHIDLSLQIIALSGNRNHCEHCLYDFVAMLC